MKRVSYACLLILITVALAQVVNAQLANSCWPKFRRDLANTGQGIYGGTGSDLTWTFPAGAAIRSSPAVGADGTVYFACNDGYLYAVAGSGVPLWTFNCNCFGSASPTIGADGTIYIGSAGNFLYAINPNGTLKWKKSVTARLDSSVTIAYDGTIYFGCINGTFYAVRSNNSTKWTYTAGGAIASSPAIAADGTILFGCQDGGLYAVYAAGTLRWKFAPPGAGSFVASPAVGPDGTVYIGCRGGFFYAVRSNGTQKWRANAGGEVWSSAALDASGNVYYGCRDGKLHALSSFGAQRWTFATGHYVDSSPAVGVDGGIYAGSVDGRLYSLNPDGTQRWNYDTGAAIYSSPAIGPAGALFLGADNGTLYCFAADSTPPEAPTVSDDGDYTSQLDRLHGSWTASDPESGIFCYEYCIGTAPGLDDAAPWLNVGGATEHTRTGLSLVDTQTYYITVRAFNGAGLQGPQASSDGITADATAPLQPQVTDDGRYTSNANSLHAQWSSQDPESGVAGYQYSIGTAPASTNVVGWTDAGSATSVTHTGLSLQTGSTYYFNVKAGNTGGIWSAVGSSDGITVDTTPPSTPSVVDAGEFTADPGSIFASWSSADNESGIVKFEYSVGISPGGTQVLTWTDAGTSTQATIAGLTLTNGVKYYVNVRATNGAELVSAVGSSDGATLDITPPTTPVVTDDGDYAGSETQLQASWTSSDAQSGIAQFEYAVGTTPGGADVLDWTSAGTQTSVTIEPLSLADGETYFIAAKATNGAGAESETGISDGITVDLTPPSRPVVTDDGSYTTDGTQLHATWTSSDLQSGIAKYECSIGTLPDATDILGWTDAGTSTDYTITGLDLAPGLDYYINVRATNGAGLVSQVGSSDGIYVESTPPTTPVVTDEGDYTQSTTTLAAAWTSEDPETGVAAYEYSIGTEPGLDDVVPWTPVGLETGMERGDLTLESGVTYYVNVKAINGVGLISEIGSSDGITVDTTEPEAPIVVDDGDYTASSTQLHVMIECEDPESGIAYYECAVGSEPGGTDILDWTDLGPGPEITITELALENGSTYYISARATNGAGITGEVGISDGIILDTTPPIDLIVIDDGEYTGFDTSLHGAWSAFDPESGIAGYRYCIGTGPGLSDTADWLDVGDAAEDTREGLSLVTGVTYYITVVATNGAGGDSEPVSSDGIMLDLTAPSTPVVTDTGEYWGYKTSMWGSWSAEDAESGIAEYQMSVGTSPGEDDVAAWQSVGDQTSFTRTGLHLTDGVTYYINIKARNGAGLWGDVGSSDGVLIDTTRPTTPVVIDDGDTTSVLDSLHATWHSEDPESGIAEYVYCIGTSPGATDVVVWTSAGLDEDVTVTDLDLDPVLRYYFSVRARSNAGAWSAISASDGIGYGSGAAIWWRFRNDSHNMGRGLFDGTTVNDVGWIVPTQGYVESSPAIAADGTCYLGSGDGKLYAVTQNGTIRWVFDAGAPIDSSPAVSNDGMICFGCGDGKVYCISPSGELEWEYQTGGPVRSSPLIKDNVVYVGSSDHSLHAIDSGNGTGLWNHTTGGLVWSSPAIDQSGVVYFASQDSYLYAVNPGGTLKWRFMTGSAVICSPAIGSDSTIYFGSGDGNFYAINPDGSKKWQFGVGSLVNSSPAIGPDGNIYFGTGYDGGDGRLYALRPDGTQIWRVDLPGGGIHSSPAIDPSGMIFVGACDSKMYAFKPDGSKCWEYETGSSVVGSPALGADSSVVFGSYDGSIYCLRDVTSKDLTPPTTPVVTVPDTVLPANEPFAASWIADDPDTMVAEYTYAVGTQPEASDVAGWTSAGIETSMSRDDLILQVGQTYYVSVKARNPSQRWSEIGVSEGVTVIPQDGWRTIGGIKSLDDGTVAFVQSKLVNAVFDDCFFIEEADRSAGIRCVEAGVELQVGDLVDVQGTLVTLNGEKVLSPASHALVGSGQPVEPLGLSGRQVSLAAPDPFGLKVRIWGRVTAVEEGRFVIDDGSGIEYAGGGLGIEVRGDAGAVAVDDYVGAGGILCRELVGDEPSTVLRMTVDDAVTLLN